LSLALSAAFIFGLTTTADARALMVAPATPGQLAAQADLIIIGKVVEIEKDTVEATQFRGAPKDQKMTYKIAVIKLEESIIGGKGLTQFRVGFPENAGATPPGDPGAGPALRPGRPIRPGFGPVALTAGQEGCFMLTRHHEGDFYILAANGTAAPLNKKDETYAKQMEEIKKIAKTISDPVTALKAKDVNDRFDAAFLILQRYQTNTTGKPASRESIPAEESKLIVALLSELPWQPKEVKPRLGSDPMPPSRSAIWYMVQQDLAGWKQPVPAQVKPGETPIDFNKVMDEASAKYLKENGEKIKLKGYVK
jgi:hypothetical protein